jgi:hypothetical protein
MSFVLSLFAAVAVQKNIRDVAMVGDEPQAEWTEPRENP